MLLQASSLHYIKYRYKIFDGKRSKPIFISDRQAKRRKMLSKKIRDIADTIGIDALGFAEASEFTDYTLNHAQRKNPKRALPGAKTIIFSDKSTPVGWVKF